MNDAYGVQAGGHTMNFGYAYHGSTVANWSASCSSTHCDGGMAPRSLIHILAQVQTDIGALLDALAAELITAGVMDADYHVITGQHTKVKLAAFLNFRAIERDRSLGFHNPQYTEAVLENTLEIVFGI
ncbi:MAG: hypothetical protein U5K32_00865 [Bacteroidales bacterium]|nr:hypothetical protein [Bacteroidales bacterium]